MRRDQNDWRKRAMRNRDASTLEARLSGYRRLRLDPRYEEIKRIIDEFPPEKLDLLKRYIDSWLRDA